MTDNPWSPIDTMPLSAVGTEVDVREDRRLHSGVRVSGIRLEHDLIDESFMGDRAVHLGPIDDFTITHTTGTIRATLAAEWRPHV